MSTVLRRSKRERFSGDVVTGHRRKSFAGVGAPDADHRQLVGDVHDRHVPLGVQLEETAVAVDRARSADDPEQIVPETSHR